MIIKTRSSRVIIRHWNGTVLLVFNTKYKVWEFPGGTLDEGEDYYAAACRELTEETGLSTKGKYLMLLGNGQFIDRKGEPHECKAFWASRMVVWGEINNPSLDKNIREVGWIKREDFPGLTMHPYSRFIETLLPKEPTKSESEYENHMEWKHGGIPE